VRIEEIDGAKVVKNVAQNMEEIFRKKAEATRVSIIKRKRISNVHASSVFFVFFNWKAFNNIVYIFSLLLI